MSAKPDVGAQLVFGVVALIGGPLLLLRARAALLHHSILWSNERGNITWMDPWQAFVAYGLLTLLGLFALIDGIRKCLK